MMRFVIPLVMIAGIADAQSVKLLDAEIEALLSGNTAVGEWGGATYRQYFDPDGTTIYVEDGTDSALGAWRVSEQSYQSRWPGDVDWTGWFVMEYAGQFFWVSKSTPPTPFRVLEGEQLVMD